MQVAVQERKSPIRFSPTHTTLNISQKQSLVKYTKLWPPTVAQLLTQLGEYGKAFTDNHFEIQCLRVVGHLASKMLYEGSDWLKYYMSVLRVFDGHLEHECPTEDKEILFQVRSDKELQQRILFLVLWEISQFRSKEFMHQVYDYHLKYYCGVDR